MRVKFKHRTGPGSGVIKSGPPVEASGELIEIKEDRASIMPDGKTGVISINVKDIVHAWTIGDRAFKKSDDKEKA